MSTIHPKYHDSSMSLADYSSESDTSLADSDSELESILETQNASDRVTLIQKKIEQFLSEGKLERATQLGRMAGNSQGHFLELVAMKYIERGELIPALTIGRELPTDLQNRPFRTSIERSVAKKYIECGDLESARAVAMSSTLTAREAIFTWIVRSETNGKELPFERLIVTAMLTQSIR